MFDDDFCRNLPEDALDAASVIVEKFFAEHSGDKDDETKLVNRSADYIRAMRALQSFSKSHGLEKLKLSSGPELSDNPAGNSNSIVQWFAEARKNVKIAINQRIAARSGEHYDAVFHDRSVVELTDDEFQEIQRLINETRELLTAAEYMSANHKARLLRRLEALQAELHKRMSNLDRFWGFLGEAGIACGKFGNDAKPLFDRVESMVKIVYGAQARTHQLPGPINLPALPDYSEE